MGEILIILDPYGCNTAKVDLLCTAKLDFYSHCKTCKTCKTCNNLVEV